MRRRVKNEDRMPCRRTVGAEKGGSRLAFEGQAIVWCTSTVPGYTVGGRRGRFPDYATKSGVRWLSHKAMHRTGTLVRRALAEDGNSGDRDTISDGRAATSRGSHRGDGGIADIAEFAMEDVIGIYAPTLDLFSVGGYVKIGRATLWRYKYVAPRVESCRTFWTPGEYYSRVNSTREQYSCPGVPRFSFPLSGLA